MNLSDLIARLEAADPQQVVKHGFNHPHSYRGDYMDLAFEPATDVSVADMLADARSALGATYEGWKGGDFTMGEHTWCWLSQEGDASGETISALLLDLMLAEPAPAAVSVPPPAALDLLSDVDAYLCALHVHVARHDQIGADGVCGGCLLRERIAAALPALAAVPVPPPTDRAAIRDRIRRAVCEAEGFGWDTDMLEPDEYGDVADAVLAVLPEPADRAAILTEAADYAEATAEMLRGQHEFGRSTGALDVMTVLRRLAAEAPTTTKPETGSCVHCGKPVRCISGTLTEWWVHAPGGQAFCYPWQPASSPRATPQPAAAPEECGRTKGVAGTEYPPCGRPPGHEEAYCRSVDGKQHFLAVGYDEPHP